MTQPTRTFDANRPNAVVLELTTSIVIPDFHAFYPDASINTFRPRWTSLPEGSLVTSVFIKELRSANLTLLLVGILLGLFIRNIFVSGEYVTRIQGVKKKTLFWLLFASQFLAPIAFIPGIMSYFHEFVDCTISSIVAEVIAMSSLSFLVTGVLGAKAYRCLDKSRVVLCVLVVCQFSLTVVSAIDLHMLRGRRRLSGSCTRAPGQSLVGHLIIIQFLESLFIAGCYSYAVWKSRGKPDVRGRISISLSLDDFQDSPPKDRDGAAEQGRRGWWDYVPKPESLPSNSPSEKSQGGFISKVRGMWSPGDGRDEYLPTRKPSLHAETPIPQTRTSSIRIAEAPNSIPRRGGQSPVPSSAGSRLSKLMPRMVLFKSVLKDELLYTTFIAACSTLVAIITLMGTNLELLFTIQGWVALNWSIISILSVHSFGRVVARHEKETMLRHPSSWDVDGRARMTAGAMQRRSRPPWSPVSIASHRKTHRLHGEDSLSPLGPSHDRYGGSMSSWNSGYAQSQTASVTLHSPAPSLHSDMMVFPSDNTPVILPSPRTDEFDLESNTGHSTHATSPVDTHHIIPKTSTSSPPTLHNSHAPWDEPLWMDPSP